ncbi:MAG: LuxR C-terminal-related transcriptional regulator [Anaerolineae bacterium]
MSDQKSHKTVSAPRLLRTKFFAPRRHAKIVPRRRLLMRLDEGRSCKLTLISAPAGFGKTTLLSAWIEYRAEPIAWLSLDERDNDPPRFWAYVIAALQTVWSEVGRTASDMLHAPQAPPLPSILTELLNDVAMQPDETVLILDDYHVIVTGEIHEGLTFLLENLPPQLHLMLASRTRPPLPLSRLRARRQLVELHTADLRFTAEETDAFFRKMEGLRLDAADVATLAARTEGWAAGLQLAALSLLETDNISRLLHSFSGSHRYIFDYLAHEVLNRQPPRLRAFLLHTSLLERFSAPLCNAVTAERESQRLLEHLETANLFIVPLDQRRRWYRYHHLFADFLQAQLREILSPAEIKALHRRAGEWYAAHGFTPDAIYHALAADDAAWADTLITQAANEMFAHSELRTLIEWIESLPASYLATDLPLNMIAAWARLATGQFKAVEPHLHIVEQLIGVRPEQVTDPDTLPTETRGALAEVACLRASLTLTMGFDLPRVKTFARTARRCLADARADGIYNTNFSLRGVAAFNLALAYEYEGQTSAAVETFEEAVTLTREDENLHLLPMSISHLGHLCVVQGRLHDAAATYETALASLAGKFSPSPLSGIAHTGLAEVLYEWNELQRAVAHLEEGIAMGERWTSWDILLAGYTKLAEVAAAQGEFAQAAAHLDALTDYAQEHGLHWALPAVAGHRALLDLRRGDIASAARWATSCALPEEGPLPYMQENEALVLAQVRHAQGKPHEAAHLLTRLLAANEAARRWGRVIHILTLQALVWEQQGERKAGLAALTRALELAEPEGYVRTFVDAGAPLRALLAHIPTLPDYVARLQAAFEVAAEEKNSPTISQPLVEPLTEREMEVLRLIAQGLTNREIANRLFISTNTVKTHARHIYEKLNVRNRAQATTRAMELGLL